MDHVKDVPQSRHAMNNTGSTNAGGGQQPASTCVAEGSFAQEDSILGIHGRWAKKAMYGQGGILSLLVLNFFAFLVPFFVQEYGKTINLCVQRKFRTA